MENNFKQLCAQVDDLRDDITEFAQKLISFKAVGPDYDGPGEWEKSRFIDQLLRPIADEIKEYHSDDNRLPGGKRPNIAARIFGKDRSKTLWFMGHMDVVPAGDESDWATPPFEGVLKDGKLFGRGSEDNHQGLVGSIFILKVLKEAGFIPPINVGVLCLSDEETGNNFGIQHILKVAAPEIFNKQDMFMIPDGGTPQGEQIEVAEKGIFWFKVITTGEQCHASTPAAGVNANTVGARIMLALEEELPKNFPEVNELFDPPVSTFTPTIKYSNDVSYNIVPGKDIFGVDCRLLPGIDSSKVTECARTIANRVAAEYKAKVIIDIVQDKRPAPATPADANIATLTADAIKAVNNVTPKIVGIGGGTFATFLRYEGYEAVVYSKLENMLHKPNEYCLIDNLISDMKVFCHIINNAK